MNDIDLTDSRAEQVQPQGFVPSHLAEPMLRDRDARSTALEYVAESPGEIRLAADLIASPANGKRVESRGLAETISQEATRLQRLVKALAAGALAALVLTVGLAAGPSTGRAEAAEAAPVAAVAAATYRVTLAAAPVTVYVRATVYTPTARGWWCASLYSSRGRIAGTCSISSSFPIPVTIDPRSFPVGRTSAQVVDDASDVAVSNVTFDARRPSRFNLGTWTDQGRGDIFVSAPLTMYSAPLGRYIPQQYSPVQVQVAGRHGWVTVATLTTTRYGIASGTVHLGGGPRTFRVARVSGATVWSTVGTTHRMNLLTEPVDVN